MASIGVVVAVVSKAEGCAQVRPVSVATRVSGCRIRLPQRNSKKPFYNAADCRCAGRDFSNSSL
jgi:hypothetical protein